MKKVDEEGAKAAGDGAGEERGAAEEAWDMLGGSVCVRGVEGSGGSSSGRSSGSSSGGGGGERRRAREGVVVE